MRSLNDGSPAGQGKGFQKQTSLASGLHLHSTLQAAALQALDTELAIVVAAADHQASGNRLSWDDHDRLHQSHQFLIRILADLRGVEVLT